MNRRGFEFYFLYYVLLLLLFNAFIMSIRQHSGCMVKPDVSVKAFKMFKSRFPELAHKFSRGVYDLRFFSHLVALSSLLFFSFLCVQFSYTFLHLPTLFLWMTLIASGEKTCEMGLQTEQN